MIVRRLRLHPFAGTPDREVRFEPGLNVVLGRNETGKTTLGKALRQVLFVSTRLNQSQARREVKPYLPIGGGDTIRVSADLEHEAKTWRLEKRWVAGNSASELALPSGGILTDHDAVQATLASDLLQLNQGTWEHVLFAYQGGVDSNLENIGEGEEIEDLNELLRRSVFETDGVSLEALAEGITHRWEDAFGRWDREAGRPEGNRGIDQPWQRGAGSIVNAWYDRERARQARDEAESYYRRLDEITTRLHAAARENEELETWVDTREEIAADAEKRVILDGKLARVANRETELKRISQAWPAAREKLRGFESRSAERKRAIGELTDQLGRAQAWEAAGKKRQVLEQAMAVQDKRTAAERSLGELAHVDPATVETLERLDQEKLRLQSRLDAAQLSVEINARRAMEIETESGIEPAQARSLADGESLAFQASARAAFRHADWDIEIRSGDIDVEAEQARFRELTRSSSDILAKLGARDLAEARKLLATLRERQQEVKGLGSQLEGVLEGRNLEDLRTEVEAISGSPGNEPPPSRNAAEIAEARGEAQSDLGNLDRQAEEIRRQVAQWQADHGSPDDLLDQLIGLRAERRELDQAIAELRPLPEDAKSPETFLTEFRRRRTALEERRRGQNDLLVEKAEWEGKAPAIEPAEAAEQLAEAESRFDKILAEGEAIDRIQRDFETLREQLDQGTLTPWLDHLGEVVAPLTGDRYREIDLEGGSFTREDDRRIPFDALSMGTRACLGLAVRLSMARWFLEDRDGFLLLDDPFVDLDAGRQEAAAAILKTFAREKQVILFTCHPAHAELLGGHLVSLDSSAGN